MKDKYHMISPIMNPNQEKKTSEQNRKKDMEIKNKLTVTRRGGGNGQQGKKGERSSQGTCIKDPWTETMGGGKIECGRLVWLSEWRVLEGKWG